MPSSASPTSATAATNILIGHSFTLVRVQKTPNVNSRVSMHLTTSVVAHFLTRQPVLRGHIDLHFAIGRTTPAPHYGQDGVADNKRIDGIVSSTAQELFYQLLLFDATIDSAEACPTEAEHIAEPRHEVPLMTMTSPALPVYQIGHFLNLF